MNGRDFFRSEPGYHRVFCLPQDDKTLSALAKQLFAEVGVQFISFLKGKEES